MTAAKDSLTSIGPKRSRAQKVLRYFVRNPSAGISFCIVWVILVVALFAAQIAPYNPFEIEFSQKRLPPSSTHFFGTDEMGRDIFSRCLYGIRLSLKAAGIILGVAVAVGIPVGAIAGFKGGFVDTALGGIVDVFIAFPPFVLALAVAASIGPSLTNAAFSVSVVIWPWYARITRAQVLAVQQNTFVEAARAIGAGEGRVLFRHILIHCLSPLLVMLTMQVGFVILLTASLSFLGLGAMPPTPELGAMVTSGRYFARDYPWIPLFPGLVIFVTTMAFNLLGDALRDVLDPHFGHGVRVG